MAIVRHLEKITLEGESNHTETTCTYSIIRHSDGVYLQIDTYGSSIRKEPGKKSQTIRLTPEAIRELKEILDTNFKEV
jgi:hypothetical protein